MLDPRIYRTGLVAVALAVIVLAFSLGDQQGPLTTTLAPEAFNGGHAYAAMNRVAKRFPHRRPGTPADQAIAAQVGTVLSADGFSVSRTEVRAQTADGWRTLTNVVGVRPGLTSGAIVVVAHRDALGSPAVAEASGTAVLEELAHVLAGETHQRSVVLASTSGSTGAAGAAALARSLPLDQPVDAVIVLGDLAGTTLRQPIVVPWSNSQTVAPPMLRNTVARALSQQAQLAPGSPSLGGQFAHLAFPFTATEQGPFGARGEPAVLMSLSGDRAPGSGEDTSPTRVAAMGRSVLLAINALDAGATVPAPSAYLLFAGKVVPPWAIRLFVLALMMPVLAATVDGMARARRRGHPVMRWAVWVLAAAVPFVLALVPVLGARLFGLIASRPPGPVSPDAVPPHGAGIAILALMACVIALGFLLVRPLVIRLADVGTSGLVPDSATPGAASGLLLVLCAASLAIWASNPFAAALLIPALHFWMWVVAPDLRLRRALALALLVAGLAAPALVIAYYARSLGVDPFGLAWSGVLLVAGGHLGLLTVVEWSVVAGCAFSLVLIAARSAREAPAQEPPVTIRGPITYAGPGSLGGTKSALRR
jgi:peptidase M28-like protein